MLPILNVMTISMGEIFGNFILFKGQILKFMQKIGKCPKGDLAIF